MVPGADASPAQEPRAGGFPRGGVPRLLWSQLLQENRTSAGARGWPRLGTPEALDSVADELRLRHPWEPATSQLSARTGVGHSECIIADRTPGGGLLTMPTASSSS